MGLFIEINRDVIGQGHKRSFYKCMKQEPHSFGECMGLALNYLGVKILANSASDFLKSCSMFRQIQPDTVKNLANLALACSFNNWSRLCQINLRTVLLENVKILANSASDVLRYKLFNVSANSALVPADNTSSSEICLQVN